MTISAEIKFVQGALTPPGGQALIGVSGTPVVASNVNNAGVNTYAWFMFDVPPTSSVPTGLISSGPTLSFTPDVPGGYLVRLTVFDLAGNSAVDFRVFQVPEHSGRFIPPFDADAPALNFGGQSRGWAPDMEQWLRYLDGETPTIVATTGTIHNLATTDSNGQTIRSIRFTGAAPVVGGLAGGYEGRELVIYADGGPVAFLSADGGSLAANQFSVVKSIPQGGMGYLIYANGKWRLLFRYVDQNAPTVVATTGTIHDQTTFDANGEAIRSFRFTGAAPILGGLSGGWEGREIIVYTDGGPLAFLSADGGSGSANRFSVVRSIPQGGMGYLIYANGAWRMQFRYVDQNVPTVVATTGTIHDLATFDANREAIRAFRFTGAAPVVGGLAGGWEGREIIAYADGGPLAFLAADGSSGSANRFPVVRSIPQGGFGYLIYSNGAWRVLFRYVDQNVPFVVSTTGAIHDQPTVDANGENVRAIRFTGAAPSLGGLAGPYEGREMLLYADGGPVTIVAADSGSSAANRFGLGSTISQGNFAYLIYSNALWRAAAAGSTPPVNAVQLHIGGPPGYTDQNVFTRQGGMALDLGALTTLFPATVGSLNRSIKFQANVQKTSGATSVEVKLVDITHAVDVTGSDMTYNTDNNDATLTSSVLTVGSSAGNLRSDAVSIYEVQLIMNGGTPSVDKAYLLGARFIISYA